MIYIYAFTNYYIPYKHILLPLLLLTHTHCFCMFKLQIAWHVYICTQVLFIILISWPDCVSGKRAAYACFDETDTLVTASRWWKRQSMTSNRIPDLPFPSFWYPGKLGCTAADCGILRLIWEGRNGAGIWGKLSKYNWRQRVIPTDNSFMSRMGGSVLNREQNISKDDLDPSSVKSTKQSQRCSLSCAARRILFVSFPDSEVRFLLTMT